MNFFIRQFLPALLMIALLGGPVFSAEDGNPPIQPTFPGASEILPRLADLKMQSSNLQAKLEILKETGFFESPLLIAEQRATELNREIEHLVSPTGRNYNRLLDIRSQLVEHQGNLASLLNGLSVRLNELEALQRQWQELENFWQQWHQALLDHLLKTQQEAFKEAAQEIGRVRGQIVSASKPLVGLQEEVVLLQERTQVWLAGVDSMLKIMRGKTFEKTSESFTNPDFYRQFDRNLPVSIKKGIEGVSGIDRDFFLRQGWLVGVQLLSAVFLAGFLLYQRHQKKVAEEWRFILSHPLATAIFVSTIACAPLYTAPPTLWRWVLTFLGAFSSAVLVSGLLGDAHKKLMIYVLAGVFVLTLGLQIIALPLPLYRLYLAVLSLLGIPFLLILAARHPKIPGTGNYFILALRLGAAMLFLSFIAQWGGFSTLSSRLVESSIKTVFLWLFSWMTLHLGKGALQYLLNSPFLQRWRFVSQSGSELESRLRTVLLVFIFASAGFYLLEIWGVFPSVGQAWQAFLQLGFTLGHKKISMDVVLLALLTLYIAIQGSWIIRALLDTEFFPHRNVDRGVHDSIMKLLHYAVITFGFLLAVSLIGFELQNLMVLAGALGIGIGFGLQNIVNNFVSGLVLLFERPVKVGDMIMIDQEWCTVKKIGMRATTVETFDQSEIIVPNSDLISEKVTNWTFSSEQSRVVVPVGVAYGSDVPKVLEILITCAIPHPKVLENPEPSALFIEFGDSSLNFELRAWVGKPQHRLRVKSDLLMEIDRKFREAGVEIPFPQRDLHLRSIDAKTLGQIFPTQPEENEK